MGTKEGEGVSGKYILIEAPNFNNAPSPGDAMGTYLRLGAVKDPSLAANPNAPKASGEDLASKITTFIDDTRVREGCPNYIPPGERQAETAKLHTKGGWRDHSDGNRVTTTRGDKVEIIKGNYRMLVLGRQDDEAGWDVSGGHVGESGITYSGASSIEYTTEFYGGTWAVVEHTIKGHVHTAFHGQVFDYFCGEVCESITGSESPSATQPNPDVTNKTWAESIGTYTGSAALPVPLVTTETWAQMTSDTTNAQTITSATTAETIASTTTAQTMVNATTASTVTNTTSVGTETDTVMAGAMTSTTTAGTITNSTTAGTISDTTIANTESMQIGMSNDITIGMSNQVNLGMMNQVIIGANTQTTIGAEANLKLAESLSLTIGAEYAFALSEALHFTIGASIDFFAGLKLDICLAPVISISVANFEIEPIKIIL